VYQVTGKSFLLFPKWSLHQRLRTSRAKYPAPEAGVSRIGSSVPCGREIVPIVSREKYPSPEQKEENFNSPLFAASCGKLPPESESESNSESESSSVLVCESVQKNSSVQDPTSVHFASKNGRVAGGSSEKFLKFWKAYPRQEARKVAEKAFAKLNPSNELLAIMLAWIEKAKLSMQWQNPEKIPHPTTWLNQQRWDGDTPPIPTVSGMIRAPSAKSEPVKAEPERIPPPEVCSEAWFRAREKIRAKIGDRVFNTWFSAVVFRGIDAEGVLDLSVPSESIRTCILGNYESLLLESAGAEKLTIRLWDAA
jgi:hypothetical protein